MQDVPPMYARIQDVILLVIFSTKCYTNTYPIINSYIATSILMYVYDCNRKFPLLMFYHTKNEKCMWRVTPQKKDTSINIYRTTRVR
jgi:hypothetical protein